MVPGMSRLLFWALAASLVTACSSSESASPMASSDKITETCRQLTALDCAAEMEADCVAALRAERSRAASVDCEAGFDAYIECTAAGPVECVDSTARLPVSCEASFAQYSSCLSTADPSCKDTRAAPSPNMPCGATCGAASATCTDASPVQCVCTLGLKRGKQFRVQSCGDLADGLKENCL
jgi:hypothetical protein